MRIFIKIIVVCILLAGGVGCKSKKHTVQMGVGTSTNTELGAKTNKEVIDDALKAQLQYDRITTKGSIEFKAGKSAKRVSTVFKLVKDNIIQASVQPFLGMEVIRITFTPDSIFVLDRYKQQYVADNFSDVIKNNNIDFTFYNLQAVLTNQLFVPGKKQVEADDYKSLTVKKEPTGHTIKTTGKSNMTYNFAIDGATNRVESTQVHNKNKSLNLLWRYQDFIIDRDYIYPQTMTATVDINKQQIQLGVSYTTLSIDTPFNVDYKIPKNYKKVDFKTLIETYLK